MTLLVILLLLALLFGIGAVVEGILWLFLLVVVLVAAAGYVGYSKLRG